MGYNFPNNPVENQEYTPPVGGQTYIYKAPRWLVKGVPPVGGDVIPSGIEEAPADGEQYARQDAEWTIVEPGISDWTEIAGKPATFPPTLPIPWADVSDKPATFPPTLPIAQASVSNLTTDLANKVIKTGDTMTGPLIINPGSLLVVNAASYASVNVRYNASFGGILGMLNGANDRYQHYFDDTSYKLRKFNDAAVSLDALTLTRADGLITVAANPTAALGIVTKQYADALVVPLAPKASPVFTGDPQAPTPSTSDSDTSIATTGFVKAQAYLTDAPNDGAQYARKSTAWAVVDLPVSGVAMHPYMFYTTTTAPPAAGQVRFNNATQSATTVIYYSYTNEDGVDLKTYFQQRVKVGDSIYIQDRDEAAKWQLFEISSAFTDNGTYASIPVVWKAGGAVLTQQRIIVTRETAGQAAGISQADADNRYVNLTGDVMNGNLTIAPTGHSQLVLQKSASGQASYVQGQLNSLIRWVLYLGDGTAEGGANAGSNFVLRRYDDSGAFIDSPLTINRATGLATVSGDPATALGIANKQYADRSYMSGLISLPQSGEVYTLILNSRFAGTVTKTTVKLTTGTATVTFRLNGTAFAGGTHAGSSSETSTVRSVPIVAGDDITLTVASVAGPYQLAWAMEIN